MILQTVVMGYWIALFGLLLTMLSLLVTNLLTFLRLQAIGDELISTLPTLSILVPARNEEQSIEACARSLVGVPRPEFPLPFSPRRFPD